ncbi:unnamed protein product [Adineta steineri]|uniref:Tripeptidyl-peptidase 1 n=1 Tax=Adineta steineri TaxID=433720 RepID=A0A818VUT8_9BILA|nr:unnamed protein product [Adineta steineri]
MFFIIILYYFVFLIIHNQCKIIISPPKHWVKHAHIPHENRYENFYFYLKQKNNELLNKHLHLISNPRHNLYHNTSWLTLDQITRIVKPDSVSIKRLYYYLWSNGINLKECRHSRDGGILVCPILLTKANKILSANYTDYRHRIKNINITRTLSFILPNYLSNHIVTISPTTIFPDLSLFHNSITSNKSKSIRQKRQDDLCSCQSYIKPCYLRNHYDIHQYHAHSSTNITLSIIGLANQYINDNDTNLFLKFIDNNNDNIKPKINILGYNNQSIPGREASLDIQYALAIARGVQVTFWSITNLNDPFSDFLFQLANMKHPPDIISISYGFSETRNDYTLFQKAIDQELQKAAARGITIVAATGDNGVGGDSVDDCQSYHINFPASSPWVTAVGGTMNCLERGAFFSSGGFSTYEVQPVYQQNVVLHYLHQYNSTLPHANLFNNVGRAVPDVSLYATRYLNIVNGLIKSTSGTSAAAPIFAAIIALLNDYQVRHGRKRLGFLNPLLYQYASDIFHDITTGYNVGCNTTGFHAGIGWDPVTGLGRPSFIRFQKVLDTINLKQHQFKSLRINKD